MPRVDARPLAGEEGEALIEAGRQGPDADRAHPRRGQLDRQGQPVQPPADLHDRRQGAVVEPESGARLGGSLGEQLDSGGRARFVARARCRHAQRLQQMDGLPRQPERLPAGGQDGQPRALSVETLDQGDDRVEDVFAIVEHQ